MIYFGIYFISLLLNFIKGFSELKTSILNLSIKEAVKKTKVIKEEKLTTNINEISSRPIVDKREENINKKNSYLNIRKTNLEKPLEKKKYKNIENFNAFIDQYLNNNQIKKKKRRIIKTNIINFPPKKNLDKTNNNNNINNFQIDKVTLNTNNANNSSSRNNINNFPKPLKGEKKKEKKRKRN